MTQAIQDKIATLVQDHSVVLFMKGSQQFPQCGFSATVVDVLSQYDIAYQSVNVLSDPEIRQGIKDFSDWPTIPQLYVKGEFIGGCDIVREMDAEGELADVLGVSRMTFDDVRIEMSAAAVAAIRHASNDEEGDALRFECSKSFEYGLYFDNSKPEDIVQEFDGLKVVFDTSTARRVNNTRIDYIEAETGAGFKIENPNEPPKVKDLQVHDLKGRLEASSITLIDVREADELERAKIEGAKWLNADSQNDILALPKDQPLAFICHHGGRSAQAAAYFLQQGFSDVHNVVGGIDAWSREVDASLPRY